MLINISFNGKFNKGNLSYNVNGNFALNFAYSIKNIKNKDTLPQNIDF